MQNGSRGNGGVNVGVIVLAAGGSTRLGSPKQLLAYRGRTLLRRAAETALATGCRPVVVVLGAGAERLREEVAGLDVQAVTNVNWHKGMGTSIQCGITALERLAPGVEGVLLMLCDQPFVGAEGLAMLVRAFLDRRGSCAGVAAAYGGAKGVPAVFGRGMFAGLRELPDETGAKRLLRQPGVEIGEVSMPEAETDIDTRAQYEELSDRPSG